MKKLTELDLQTALDECDKIRFRCHGAWLAGMVNRLNNAIMLDEVKSLRKKPAAVVIPAIKTTILAGNVLTPEIPCKS